MRSFFHRRQRRRRPRRSGVRGVFDFFGDVAEMVLGFFNIFN